MCTDLYRPGHTQADLRPTLCQSVEQVFLWAKYSSTPAFCEVSKFSLWEQGRRERASLWRWSDEDTGK
jgi:uncharacterized protein Usg